MSDILWSLRARSIKKARKSLLRGDAEGLHDLRVALRRTEATAAALGRQKIEGQSRSLVRSLSPLRQLEVDRKLLARLQDMGRIPANIASGLELQWSARYSEGLAGAGRKARSGKMRRLEKKTRRLARPDRKDSLPRLEVEERRVERRLAPPPEDANDRRLHRFRISVKRARYLAEDLAACGVPGLEKRIAREKELQDALGHWNDIHLFRERLKKTREDAERRGTVSLVQELDQLIDALKGTEASARRKALSLARRFARVVPFAEATG